MFLINEGRNGFNDMDFDLPDAIHVHGYSFYVIAMERHGIKNENSKLTNYVKGKPPLIIKVI